MGRIYKGDMKILMPFFQATESLMAMSGTLDEGFDEEAYAINRQFKSFKRRYLKAKEDKK